VCFSLIESYINTSIYLSNAAPVDAEGTRNQDCDSSLIESYIYTSIYLSIYLTLHLRTHSGNGMWTASSLIESYIYTSIYLSINISIYLSVCIYIYVYTYIYIGRTSRRPRCPPRRRPRWRPTRWWRLRGPATEKMKEEESESPSKLIIS